MAKKTRMGRNLNALLGGATRTRSAKSEDSPASESEKAAPSSTTDTAQTAEPAVIKSKSAASSETTSKSVESSSPGTPTETPGTASAVSATNNSSKANSSAANSPEKANDTGSVAGAKPIAAANESSATDSSDNHTKPEVASSSTTASSTNAIEPTKSTDSHPSDRLRLLGVDQITRGMYQPRRHFDQDLLQELADSIKAQGLIQPILVRAYGGKFELIAGERRWRASQLAGISDIPAIVRDMDDQSVAAVSLIENIQRADLNPLEEAQALERLCAEFSMTHQQVAEAVGRSRVAVTNLMRLLELHDDVKSMVDSGELDMGHARALLGAPRAEQPVIAKRIVQQGLTVRAVEKLVKDMRDGKTAPADSNNKPDPNIEALGQKLSKVLGAPVNIKHQQSGSGKLEISYTSIDELDGILKHIK